MPFPLLEKGNVLIVQPTDRPSRVMALYVEDVDADGSPRAVVRTPGGIQAADDWWEVCPRRGYPYITRRGYYRLYRVMDVRRRCA